MEPTQTEATDITNANESTRRNKCKRQQETETSLTKTTDDIIIKESNRRNQRKQKQRTKPTRTKATQGTNANESNRRNKHKLKQHTEPTQTNATYGSDASESNRQNQRKRKLPTELTLKLEMETSQTKAIDDINTMWRCAMWRGAVLFINCNIFSDFSTYSRHSGIHAYDCGVTSVSKR